LLLILSGSAAAQIVNGGGGGGSGTVSANNGTAGAVANYAAAAGSTTVGPDATLVDNGVNLTYSGTHGLIAPSGTCASGTPSYGFAAQTNSGISWDGANNDIVLCTNSATEAASFGALFWELQSGGGVLWSANNNVQTGVDLGLSRSGANLLAVGTGAQGNEAGFVRAGNACRVTADITLPVNTATNVCSWSLPAVAKAWGWQCSLIWTVTVGTGTNTMSVGVNASQTPTGATNAAATIDVTTATLTGSQAAVPLSASGAVNILTSGTYSPAATLEQAQTSGTLLASGTAGTFAVTMTAAGTTATAAAKAGSTCWFY